MTLGKGEHVGVSTDPATCIATVAGCGASVGVDAGDYVGGDEPPSMMTGAQPASVRSGLQGLDPSLVLCEPGAATRARNGHRPR